jgi:gamma-glutamyltranspeptidase
MFTTRPELLCTFGAVGSTHWLASQTGMAMLERGGNAFDAAVAAGFVLQIVEPHLNGPGGEVPMIIHQAAEDRTSVVCGQGTAPAAATIDRYRAQGHRLMPGTGLMAAVVPGAFDAWLMVLRDHGTMSLAEVLEPAIGYAENGFPVVPRVAWAVQSVEALFRDHWPSAAAVWLADGGPKAGALFRTPGIAATYKRLVGEASAEGSREAGIEAARRAWSQGFVAEAIDRFCRENELIDTTGERHGGVLTGHDMANWQATYEPALTYDYHGYTLCKTGPWGQGPVFLQQLALLKGFDLSAMDPTGPDFVHAIVECTKLAFADREGYYGDPDFVDVPMARLLDDGYNDTRRALISDQDRRHRRRHLPCRCCRSLGQHGLGDAERRLAAKFTGDPGTGLLPDQSRPDVLARRVAAGGARARQAAAHHVDAIFRVPRRRTLYGLRYAGRRSAGPVVAVVLPSSCPSWHGSASRNRLPDLPFAPFPKQLLPARLVSRRGRRRRSDADGDGRRIAPPRS